MNDEMTFDPYSFKDIPVPLSRDMLNLAQQYRRFDLTDIYIIVGVFIIGFVFAFILSSYWKLKKEKI